MRKLATFSWTFLEVRTPHWDCWSGGAVRIAPLEQEDVPRIRQLISKYGDQPMDLADAALVRVAERDALDTVFAVDRRDFQVYRIGKRKSFRIIPEA